LYWKFRRVNTSCPISFQLILVECTEDILISLGWIFLKQPWYKLCHERGEWREKETFDFIITNQKNILFLSNIGGLNVKFKSERLVIFYLFYRRVYCLQKRWLVVNKFLNRVAKLTCNLCQVSFPAFFWNTKMDVSDFTQNLSRMVDKVLPEKKEQVVNFLKRYKQVFF